MHEFLIVDTVELSLLQNCLLELGIAGEREKKGISHLLLLAVEVRLLAVLGGRVELRPQVLELLHAQQTQVVSTKPRTKNRKLVISAAPRETRIFAHQF